MHTHSRDVQIQNMYAHPLGDIQIQIRSQL